jgi:uncharacterized short protein YbdD (DUF466 family)
MPDRRIEPAPSRAKGGRADRACPGQREGRTEKPGEVLWRSVLSGIRRLAGMPDYVAYVKHLERFHPERSIPSERQFYEEFIRARYGDSPTRCC